MIEGQIALPHEVIAAFCERNHIRKLSLFGSVLRADFRPDSDVDMLVEFVPDADISLFDMGRMQMELTDLLGKFVDFKTEGFVSPRILQRVRNSAVTIYERS